MGSQAHCIVVGGPAGTLERAVARVDDLERRWSRFLPDSEVSRLNRRPGGPVDVSGDTLALIECSIVAWRLSAGSFDPTLLAEVIAAGYDRSFELMGSGDPDGAAPPLYPEPTRSRGILAPGPTDIVIEGRSVTLPPGSGFDPGGIGKGLAADIVCGEIMQWGAAGICVNLGGDVRVAGVGPDGGAWTVAVEHPWSEEPLARLGVADGAVATSTTLKRRWLQHGEPSHHLIDPHTGRPSDSDLTLATAVTGTAWLAEALAKAVLLAGSAHPFDVLGGLPAEGLAVDHRGRVTCSDGLAAFVGGTGHLERQVRTPDRTSRR
jgi:thiamine biosynthesis lipoprotein